MDGLDACVGAEGLGPWPPAFGSPALPLSLSQAALRHPRIDRSESSGKEGKAMLFIRPTRWPTDEPLIDELTMRMTSALRQARVPEERFCGVHFCICGAVSDSTNRVLANGAVTNTLCVHYLAYHRTEVPTAELDAVWKLPASAAVPSHAELGAPEYRLRREPIKSLAWGVAGPIREEVDEEKEVVRWRYELVLDNRSSLAACVQQASFALSLDAAYSAPEFVEAGWTLAPGEVRRVPHAPVFRVAEFRQGRSPQIAASLSVASHRAITWQFVGTYANGKPLNLGHAVVALPTVYKWNQAI